MSAGTTKSGNSSLGHWMRQVLKELDTAAEELAADPVHDLRVALRRCRSMAEGLRAIDPDVSWKKMRKAGKELFSSLGELRDVQVMMQWTTRIGAADDPITQVLLDSFRQQEQALKQHVQQPFAEFDRKQWERWARSLPRRAALVPLGGEAFQCLALERWAKARRMQSAALKTEHPAALHRLRIGLKKFRYVVENFLPERHEEWSQGLKQMQDLLGDIHDLDVLWATCTRLQVLGEPDARRRWESRIQGERQTLLAAYRNKMSGRDSLWSVWRSGLPRGEQAGHAVFKKLETWASFLDADSGHSRRITRFALQLHDGLVRTGVLEQDSERAREVLRAAAILHDVGYANGNKNHHKATRRLILKMDVPFAWRHRDLDVAALVAGYHRGALPRPSAKRLRAVPQPTRLMARQLAGILRLANAFDLNHDAVIRRIKVRRRGDYVVVYAAGLNPDSRLAEKIAGARYLLEMSCRMPIVVRPMPRTRLQVTGHRGQGKRRPQARSRHESRT